MASESKPKDWAAAMAAFDAWVELQGLTRRTPSRAGPIR